MKNIKLMNLRNIIEMKKIVITFLTMILASQIAFCDVVPMPTNKFCINTKGDKIKCPKKFPEQEYKYQAFQDSSKKWGLKDSNGEVVIPAKYDFMTDYNEELAGACLNDRCGYVDINDKWIIKPQFPRFINQERNNDGSFSKRNWPTSSTFNDGMAAVFFEPKQCLVDAYDSRNKYAQYEAVLPKNEKYYPEQWYSVQGELRKNKFYIIKGNTKSDLRPPHIMYCQYDRGYINKSGNIVLKGYNRYQFPYEFSDGLAAKYDNVTKKYGFIDKTGKYVIKPQFINGTKFRNGVAIVEKLY